MKSYFGYIRVSTVKQGQRGSSLQEQRSSIDAYAHRHGLRICAWFEETETAARQGRREFNKMLEELGRNRANGLIIHKIDRSSRNLRDWARLGELIDRGADIHFVNDNLDLNTRGGRLSADIQAVVAADYVRNLRDEVRKGRYGRLKQGYYPLPAPMGYLNCGTAKPKAIDPVRGPLVRQAFELYATGNYSVKLLAAEMAARGLTTGAGAPLPVSHIGRILHNPFYMGLMRLRSTGEVFEGNHEPLISPALFDRVQAILSDRLYPRTEIHRFRYRRLIKCEACGRSLTGERQKGHTYYRCHSYECRGTSISEEKIDAFMQQELSLLCFDDVDVGDFREVLKEEAKVRNADAGARLAAFKRDLALIEQRLERLTDAVLDGTIDKAAHDSRRQTLLTRQLELRERVKTGANLTLFDNVAESFELAFTALQSFECGGDEEKREIVRIVGSNFRARQKTIVFPMHSPFAELREWSVQNDSWPFQRAVRTNRSESLRKLVRGII
jgi:DNA invertase Pin-like site-specific DNA recombinase